MNSITFNDDMYLCCHLLDMDDFGQVVSSFPREEVMDLDNLLHIAFEISLGVGLADDLYICLNESI